MYTLIDVQPDFVVIHKAPGISFHSETGEPGLFESLRQQEKFDTLFPVHRLDKVTSGLLVMARTAEANQALVNAFRDRQVGKYYLALSDRKPRKKQGLVQGDMEPARRGAWKLNNTRENPAITQFFSQSLGPGLRLFLLKPHTGRTHQLRVALKSLGAPILGDQLYGATQSTVDRTYLHAWQLSFSLDGQTYCYQALPETGEYFTGAAFRQAISHWSQPEVLPWPEVP